MEINYYREHQHNYIIMRNTDNSTNLEYQKRMIEIKKPSNILTQRSRSINGEEYGYYDITSKISLKQLFGNRKFSMEDMRKLMLEMRQVCEVVDEYLLNVDRIIFAPNYIFYNLRTAKYSFFYNLSTPIEDNNRLLGELLDFLLENVSPEDENATEYIYSVYEYYEKGGFTIWDAFSLLPDGDEKELYETNMDMNEDPNQSFSKECFREITDKNNEDQFSDFLISQDEEPEATYNKKNSMGSVIALLLGGITGIGISLTIYLMMALSSEEILILCSFAILSVLLMIAGLVLMIIGIQRKKTKRKAASICEESTYNNECIKYDYVDNSLPKMNDFVSKTYSSDIKLERQKGIREKGSLNEEKNDQTVFFEEDRACIKYKLYSIDKKNKKHIELDNLPCTIGKLTEYADVVLDHPSISRLHARFTMDNGVLEVLDLNSTNGVYVNGVRLLPNEAKTVDLGDEIRIGNLNYCLRNCS